MPDTSAIRVCSSDDQAEWLKARRKLVTATDVPALLGISPYGSPLSVYAEKIDDSEPEPEEREIWRWGHLLEPVIVQQTALEIGQKIGRELHWEIDHALYRSPKTEILAATPDSWIGAKRFVPAECKNRMRAEDWKQGPPDYVLVQVQTQIAVLDAPGAYLAALFFGSKLQWWRVDRDDELIDRIRDAAEDFWEKRVLKRVPPPADGTIATEATRRALQRLYPKDSGQELVLDRGDLVTLDLERVGLKEEIKVATNRIEEIDVLLQQEIGPATKIILPNGVAYSWRHQHREPYTVPAGDYRVLRRHVPKKGK